VNPETVWVVNPGSKAHKQSDDARHKSGKNRRKTDDSCRAAHAGGKSPEACKKKINLRKKTALPKPTKSDLRQLKDLNPDRQRDQAPG